MPELNKLHHSKLPGLKSGKYSDGGGLWLNKRGDGGAQWFLRYTLFGRRHEMGLGRLSDVSLKEARLAAEKWRAVVRAGKDPIKERESLKRKAERADHTLQAVAEDAFEARKAELKEDGEAGRWFSPLKHHVLPKLGKVPVEDITQQDIKNTLAPIWHEKAPTADKAMTRLSIVMRHAAALGLDVDLQATDKARALLGKQNHETQHIESVPWRDVPAFYETLAEPTVTHLAMRMLILTGSRSKPLRFMRLDEVEDDIWTIKGPALKGRKGETLDLRIPLSTEALKVLELAKPHARNGFLFPGERKGVISNATMSRLMERRPMEERPHGFRTSLRVWLAEVTDAPHEVAELCIGHMTDSKVVRAYRRTDYLEQRRILLERWGQHVAGQGSAEVVRIA